MIHHGMMRDLWWKSVGLVEEDRDAIGRQLTSLLRWMVAFLYDSGVTGFHTIFCRRDWDATTCPTRALTISIPPSFQHMCWKLISKGSHCHIILYYRILSPHCQDEHEKNTRLVNLRMITRSKRMRHSIKL